MPEKKIIFTIKLNPVYLGRAARYIPHNLNHRLHPIARHRWAKEWKNQVGWLLKASKGKMPAWPLLKPQVAIIFHTLSLMDMDNSYTAAKPILDGIKECGCLIDDSDKYVRLEVRQIKVVERKNQYVEIIINTK